MNMSERENVHLSNTIMYLRDKKSLLLSLKYFIFNRLLRTEVKKKKNPPVIVVTTSTYLRKRLFLYVDSQVRKYIF